LNLHTKASQQPDRFLNTSTSIKINNIPIVSITDIDAKVEFQIYGFAPHEVLMKTNAYYKKLYRGL